MKRTASLLLVLGLGCRGFSDPTPETLDRVRAVPPLEGPYIRHQVELDIDSRWLAGQFEGVVIARPGPVPIVRAQFFPDLGGKAFDLVARPDRIKGNLPPLDEKTDVALPLDGSPHPIHFIGVTLLERFAPVTPDRVLGVHEDGRILLTPVVEGSRVTVRLDSANAVAARRFTWIYGVSWEETSGPEGFLIRGKNLRLRTRILRTQRLDRVPDAVFRLPE